jgi:hypothetical protein
VRIGKALVTGGILLCLAWFCFAQVQEPDANQGGTAIRSIEGTVLNQSGAGVPGARVLLKNGKSLQVRSFIAQQNGKYHFYGLSTDVNYEIRAQASGMTSKIKNISIFDSHKVIHLDLKLTKKLKTGD